MTSRRTPSRTSRSASAASIAPTASSIAYESRSSARAMTDWREDPSDSVALIKPRNPAKACLFGVVRPYIELRIHERGRPKQVQRRRGVVDGVEREVIAEV